MDAASDSISTNPASLQSRLPSARYPFHRAAVSYGMHTVGINEKLGIDSLAENILRFRMYIKVTEIRINAQMRQIKEYLMRAMLMYITY